MLADGSSTFDVADNTRVGKLGLAQSRDQWVSALAGSNDDAGWMVLSMLKIGDYRNARGGNPTPYWVRPGWLC